MQSLHCISECGIHSINDDIDLFFRTYCLENEIQIKRIMKSLAYKRKFCRTYFMQSMYLSFQSSCVECAPWLGFFQHVLQKFVSETYNFSAGESQLGEQINLEILNWYASVISPSFGLNVRKTSVFQRLPADLKKFNARLIQFEIEVRLWQPTTVDPRRNDKTGRVSSVTWYGKAATPELLWNHQPPLWVFRGGP